MKLIQVAKNLNYKPESTCTENSLKAEKDRLFISLLKEVEIIDKKWDNW